MAMKSFAIEASITIEATPAKVHEVLNDLGRLEDWNPFLTMDKSVTFSVSEKTVGPGAIFDYQGKRIGKGRMEIISSGPERIGYTMTFFHKKKTEVAKCEYLVAPEFEGTKVTWTMGGERDLKMHFMGAVLGFDKMMVKNFNNGLKVLRAVIE
ncbi:MAG: SRPBCC family protein [Rhodoluna sp.]